MDANLLITLQNYGLSEKEARVYLTVLELGTSIASTIARRAELNRVTTYTLLEDLKREGIVNETTKEGIKYYGVISPDILLKQLEQKYENFKEKVPELLALAEKFWNRPRVQFFEWLEGVKKVFQEILQAWTTMESPYLSFLWTQKMDPRIEKYVFEAFMPQREKIATKAKVILWYDKSKYIDYHKKHYNVLVLDKPLFKLWNEIVVYWENKVGILMYDTSELSWLIIESQTLHDGLTSMFNLIWDIYKKKKK